MNDILIWDQNASYSLRSCVTVTRRNIRTNELGFEMITTNWSSSVAKLTKRDKKFR